MNNAASTLIARDRLSIIRDPSSRIHTGDRRAHLLLAWVLLLPCWSVAQFTPGRLAILEMPFVPVGGGSYQIPNNGTAMAIREYATDGTPGISVPIPDSGPNALVINYSTLGSSLTRTPDKSKLVFAGFTGSATVGTNVSTTLGSAIPRGIGTLDASGNYERPFSSATYASQVRPMAATSDGTNYWAVGMAHGLTYMGPAPQATVVTSPTAFFDLQYGSNGLQALSVDGNDLYRADAGAPTDPSTLTNILDPGSAIGFCMNDAGTICYTNSASSIFKFVFTGSVWNLAYSFSAGTLLSRIVVDFDAPQPIIYGVKNAPSSLMKWVDTGAPSAGITLASMEGVGWFGIAFTPENCTVGASCDDGDPTTGNDVYAAGCACAGQPIDCHGTPGGPALPGTPCDDANAFTGGDTWSAGCSCVGQTVLLSAKALLAGALPTSGMLMNDQLRGMPSFPLTEPYSALGLPPTGGPTTIAPSVLAATGLDAIVDWVLVELRSTASASTVVVRRAALLQSDGDIIDLDGLSPLALPIGPGNYHIAVRHRNHLGVMTAGGLDLSGTAVTVDFRLAGTATYGTNARRNMGSFYALWSGNIVPNSQLSYTGSGNDRDPILVNVGSTTPNNTVFGYSDRDVNLNGITSYTGAGNDRDPILVNVGSTTPNALILEQLP